MAKAFPGMMGPSTAMRKTLAAYLLNATFRVHGGDDIRDSLFNLNTVYEQWPRPDEELDYPCASIVEMPDSVHDQPFSPAPLEDTLGAFDIMIGSVNEGEPPKTCLWVTGELEAMLQVDFYCDTDADRQAIEGELPNLFSPEEGCSGVAVEAPELYYGQAIQYELISQHFDDSAIYAQRNERRLRCVIQASCAIVSLRMATITATPQTCVTVVDPVDPPEDSQEG